MTYRQRAIELLSKYMGANRYAAKDIIRVVADDCQYKPCVFSKLNAPEKLEDWDVEADNKNIGFKISFYNDNQYGKEVLNLPITINGKIVGAITNVTSDMIEGCIWHKHATLEIESTGNEFVGFNFETQ